MKLTDEQFSRFFPFEYPRYDQRDVIEKILTAFNDGKHHVILAAPTGSGKSVIAVTVANALGYKNVGFHSEIITSQKCLQEQYFHDLNIPIIYGKANYQCKLSPVLNCECGVCGGNKQKTCKDCPYILALSAAHSAPICSTNYAFFLQRNKFCHNAGKYYADFIVFDECHNLEQEILSMCSFKMTDDRLQYLGYNTKGYIPVAGTSEENLIAWLNDVKAGLKVEVVKVGHLLQKIDIFQSLSDKGKISPNELKEHKKVHTRLKGIISYINQISLLLNQYEEGNRFIATFGNKEIEFKLLHGSSLFQQYISESANCFLHMSATILSKEQHCKCLGIDPDDAEYISCESRFPLYNRPIFYNPIGSMAFKDKRNTIPKMVKRVDEILTQYKNEKGIIHTVSYELTEAIMSGISNKNNWRLLVPRPNNRQEVLNHFYNSNDPLVLLSPSLTEGLDLKEDLSRFCIVCKMPYANTNDQWVKERQQEDQTWYATNTCTILMQMTGRVVRSEKDIASTYILDSCFNFLVAKYGYLFPKWWQESVFSIEDEKAIKEKQNDRQF